MNITRGLANIVGEDTKVPLRNGTLTRYINLDNAASSPPLAAVLEAVHDSMQWYASVHRGAGFKSQISTQTYEDAHATVAKFVGANPKDHIVIFGKNTTEAINKAAYRLQLQPQDIVITSIMEHHSNELPWRQHATVRHIGLDPTGCLNINHLRELLNRYAGRVKLVAITGASNVTGYIPDIHTIARLAHDAGAQILVDAAQLAAHRTINMRPLSDPAHIDYVAISAHKMYAPFGTGALIGRRDTFLTGAPEYTGGGTVEFVTNTTVDWAPSPDRDEAGSPNVVGAIALAAAIKELQTIGMRAIVDHETALVSHAMHLLQSIPGIHVYGNTHADRTGVIAFNLHDIHHAELAVKLSMDFGIATRHGCFCAQPYVMKLLGLDNAAQQTIRRQVLASGKQAAPGMVRISFGLYNTIADIDACADALQLIAQNK